MPAPALVLFSVILGQVSGPDAGHDRNAVYRALREKKVTIAGQSIALPAPTFPDGLSPGAERDALRAVAGSARAVEDLLRDSVTAPFILKVHDATSTQGDTIRQADLWFAIHADLDAIDASALSGLATSDKPVETGNMRFHARLLDDAELAARGIAKPEQAQALREWYIHSTGRLLDRIHVEATGRTVASRSAGSWVVASRTDARFDRDEAYANRWWVIERRGGRDESGPSHPYSGGVSYVKVSRLTSEPGTLLVEVHLAFDEPRAWFDGAPILRSKLSLIAQDQIRHLRRELARSREHRH